MCLPSGEYATESTQPECPVPVALVPDLDSLVIGPADDVLAVRRVRHRAHIFRVPRQRALLLMDQIRRSASVHAAANDTPSQTTTRTSSPLCASHIFTVLSRDPLTMCLPSGEYATENTESECPVSVHSCSWTKHGGQHTPRSSKR